MPGAVVPVPCDACDGGDFRRLFYKKSTTGEPFRVVVCRNCGLVQVNPQPDVEAVRPYYEKTYFTRRTARGYDDYFSDAMRHQITAVYDMNLRDLGFPAFEGDKLNRGDAKARALDVGCAAGYFVDHMLSRGWDAMGVEISPDAARFGIETLKLNIIVDDFMSCRALEPSNFDMVSLWASLEHMHSPRRVLARCRELLKPGGRMFLSTCRYGALARLRGVNWRYMNVPEHLYFFSLSGLADLAHDVGFHVEKSVTYGSGFTSKKDAGPLYALAKKFADPLVKSLDQGDMMAFHLRKTAGE